jgi:tRNA threonylcarbamoyladenosine biosynthesis protein TsaE
MHEYREGRIPVFHFDFYRLEQARELCGIGWEDYLQEAGILLVEWADRFPEAFPARTIQVRFSIKEGSQRVLELL